jgi:hypothetical protein
VLPDRLPPVGLILQHVDCDETVVDWHLQRGAAGIVIAGSGNGMLPDPMRAALARASRSGCRVVRASRVASGPVVRNAEAEVADRDDALGFRRQRVRFTPEGACAPAMLSGRRPGWRRDPAAVPTLGSGPHGRLTGMNRPYPVQAVLHAYLQAVHSLR